MVCNQTSKLENSSIRKSRVARNANSSEYCIGAFRPQLIFSILDMSIHVCESVTSYTVFSYICLCVALVHFEKFLKM